MKPSTKRSIAVSCFTLVLGCVLIAAGWGMGGRFSTGRTVSIGGANGVHIGSGGIRIGGSNGVYVGPGGISIGGNNGIYIGPEGIFIGPSGRRGSIAVEEPIHVVEGGAVTGESSVMGYFSYLNVDIALGDIYLVSGEKYTISTSYSSGKYQIKWEMDGDTLKIWSEGNMGIDLGESFNASVTVTVPTYVALKDVDLSTDLGNVVVELEGVRCVEADLKSDLGNVVCAGLTAQELEAKSDLGDVSVLFPTKQGVSYQVSSDLGEVKVADARWSDRKVEFKASAQKYYVRVHSSLGDAALEFAEE